MWISVFILRTLFASSSLLCFIFLGKTQYCPLFYYLLPYIRTFMKISNYTKGDHIYTIMFMLSYSQSNRIIKLEGLDSLVNLEELYISHNGIEEIEGLDNLVRKPVYLRPRLKEYNEQLFNELALDILFI